MNASPVSRLPRFDDPEGLSPLAIFDAKIAAAEPVEEVAPVEPVEPDLPETDMVEPEVDEDARFREEASSALQMLSSALYEFEVSAATNIAFAIKTMVGEIFPHLSSVFLTEEFALNIPELISFVPPKAKIQAPVRIAEHLMQVSSETENWPEGWEIEAVHGLEDTRVEVVWDQGGLTYDYTKILQACLTRLGEHANDAEER